MFDGLHLKRPATSEWPSRLFKVTIFAAIWLAMSCTVFEILTLICQKIKMSRDLDHAHLEDSLSSQDWYFLGQPVHKIWRFYLQPFQRLRGHKILKWITWLGPRPFQGWSVVWRLTLDIACKHTKLDNASVVLEIFQGCDRRTDRQMDTYAALA